MGRRNYRYFYFFLVLTTLLAAYCLLFTAAHLVLLANDLEETEPETASVFKAMEQTPVTVVLLLYSICILFSLLGLSSYQTYLVCNDTTTHEEVRSAKARGLSCCHVTLPCMRCARSRIHEPAPLLPCHTAVV